MIMCNCACCACIAIIKLLYYIQQLGTTEGGRCDVSSYHLYVIYGFAPALTLNKYIDLVIYTKC